MHNVPRETPTCYDYVHLLRLNQLTSISLIMKTRPRACSKALVRKQSADERFRCSSSELWNHRGSTFRKGGCSGNRVQWIIRCHVPFYYIMLPQSTAPPSHCTPPLQSIHSSELWNHRGSTFCKGGCSGNRVQWFVWCYTLFYIYYYPNPLHPPPTAPPCNEYPVVILYSNSVLFKGTPLAYIWPTAETYFNSKQVIKHKQQTSAVVYYTIL